MVKLHHPPRPQSSALLLLPAEVRNHIWHLLFADSKVVYQGCVYAAYLSTERYQVAHSCRFAYLETFALLWAHTKIVFNDCVPAPNPAGLELQFEASAPCRKLISRMDINFGYSIFGRSQDFRGPRYFAPLKEVSIGPIIVAGCQIAHVAALGLAYENADNVEADKLLLRGLSDWISSSDYNTMPFIKGRDIKDLVLRRNRKYRVFLNFMVTFNDYVTAFPRVKHYKRVVSPHHRVCPNFE